MNYPSVYNSVEQYTTQEVCSLLYLITQLTDLFYLVLVESLMSLFYNETDKSISSNTSLSRIVRVHVLEPRTNTRMHVHVQ